jgi:hypothetical protein
LDASTVPLNGALPGATMHPQQSHPKRKRRQSGASDAQSCDVTCRHDNRFVAWDGDIDGAVSSPLSQHSAASSLSPQHVFQRLVLITSLRRPVWGRMGACSLVNYPNIVDLTNMLLTFVQKLRRRMSAERVWCPVRLAASHQVRPPHYLSRYSLQCLEPYH